MEISMYEDSKNKEKQEENTVEICGLRISVWIIYCQRH